MPAVFFRSARGCLLLLPPVIFRRQPHGQGKMLEARAQSG